MTTDRMIRSVARIDIEFKTPFIIGSAERDPFADAIFVKDVNGLPAIPGTSIAGALRSAFRGSLTEPPDKRIIEADIFGCLEEKERKLGAMASRLSVSWGCIHDSDDRPVEGILEDESKLVSDPVLQNALSGTIRDHVKINHRGVADGRAKFDEMVVAAGHRFTFELQLAGEERHDDAWERLLTILKSGQLRFGGKSRRGLGSFAVTKMWTGRFDLAESEVDFDLYTSLPVSLAAQTPQLMEEPIKPDAVEGSIAYRVEIDAPDATWIVSAQAEENKNEPDMRPLTDKRIHWESGKGEVGDYYLLPGSSLKGALRHRTKYHAALMAMKKGVARNDLEGEAEKVEEALFGAIKEEDGQGRRGRVLIDDIYFEKTSLSEKLFNHVSIDRFTGGAKTESGALFTESALVGMNTSFMVRVLGADQLESVALDALKAALNDLVEGRLPIGGGAARGHGFLQGTFKEVGV